MKIYDYEGKANVVGRKIYALRKNAHLSQEDLAAKMQLNSIELSQKAISRIEKQERFVTDYELMTFAIVFEIGINDLFH